MMYSYTASRNGTTYTGHLEAADKFAVYRKIKEEGGEVLAVDLEGNSLLRKLLRANTSLTFGRIPAHEKVTMVRNLGGMLEAGLSLSRALTVLERQTNHPLIKRTVASIADDVKGGKTLSEGLSAFPKFFPATMIAMTRAGEESATLASTLNTVAETLEKSYLLGKKIGGALIYPAVVLVAMVCIGVLMLIEVVPELAQTFAQAGVALPISTQIILDMSGFLVGHLVESGLIVIGVVAAVVLFLHSAFGKRVFDDVSLRFPLIGPLVKESNAATTARTLSALLSSGVAVTTALSITRETIANHRYRAVLEEAEAAVKRGGPLSETLAKHENLYPVFVGEMVAVGDETGSTAKMLARVAEYYEADIDRATKDLSSLIEPIMILVIGAAVGFFAISMIAPIYALSNVIN